MLRDRLRMITVTLAGVKITAEHLVDCITDRELQDILAKAAPTVLKRMRPIRPRIPCIRLGRVLGEINLYHTFDLYSRRQLRLLLGAGSTTIDHVYTVCCNGRHNWIDEGFHLADVMGYIVMPSQFSLPGDP